MFGTHLKTWKDVFYTHVIFGWIVPLIFVHVFHWCDFTVWFCFDILFGNALEMWCAVGCIWAVRECMKITFIRSVKQAFINSYVPTGNRCCHTWLLCVLFCFLHGYSMFFCYVLGWPAAMSTQKAVTELLFLFSRWSGTARLLLLWLQKFILLWWVCVFCSLHPKMILSYVNNII